MNDQDKYEMCLQVSKSMLAYAILQKSNSNDGWKRSVQTAKDMQNMAKMIKRDLDSNKTAEYKMVG